jgi:hypothetical protein
MTMRFGDMDDFLREDKFGPSDSDKTLAKDLSNIDDGLNDWEVGFVESIVKRVEDERMPLTENQRTKGNQILERLGL